MDSRPSSTDEAQILLVEDNPGDVRLIKETFRDGHINNHLHIVSDGQEALDFIHRQDEYGDAPRPDIILLDLTLPKVDGEDVLHEIKRHPELEQVLVVILAGTKKGTLELHDLDENVVIQKPVDPYEFLELIYEFENFGLSVVRTRDD